MFRELKTFLAVAKEGTFAAAGHKVGLTQAAVSAQMQRLEEQLGFALFERVGRSARLNARGQQTLEQAQTLLTLYGRLGSATADTGRDLQLTVGAIASVQHTLLPQALVRLHRQRDDLRTRVVPGVSMDLLNQVDSGELDLAVMIRAPFALPADLAWTTLAREPFVLLVPKSLGAGDWATLLASQPFIRYDRHSFGGRQVDRFLRTAQLQVQDICELDDLDAMETLVARRLGVALVPRTRHARRASTTVREIALGAQTFYREIGLVHRTRLAAPAQQLADLLVQAYQA
jgi:DNA-binding transcriptional LysR family regulator